MKILKNGEMKGFVSDMTVLVDTNILIDIYANRKDFIENSLNALKLAISQYARLYISCSSLTDFHYNLSKSLHSKEKAKELVIDLLKWVRLAKVDDNCIYSAISSNMNDFEDAVIDAVATNVGADFILTRNKKDFINANNKVLSPEEYLQQY